jgi:gluconate kinase
VVAHRLANRTGHFFNASLLDSQFDDLEFSGHDARHCLIDAVGDAGTVYAAIRQALPDRKLL